MQNLFATPIPAADLKKALDLVTQLQAVLRPYLTPLTPQQRQDLPKLGDKTVAFVQQSRDYAAQNPSFVPAFVDPKEFNQDADALAGLAPLQQQLESLALDTDSTMMLAGSDAYTTALVIYNNIKFLAKNNQPGAQAAYDVLSQRFPGRPGAGAKPKALKG